MSRDVILEAHGVTRRYPGTLALNQVDFTLCRGKVHVLVGENGAGKSTLMRILSGIEQPDEGEIRIDGEAVSLSSPREASRHGIAIVHQELSVLPNLTIGANIFAGRELVKAGVWLDEVREAGRAEQAMKRLRQTIPIQTQAGNVPLGVQQIVEIARALDQQTRILILDEPTSALSNAESEQLFAVIEELKATGVTIVYISHRMHELLHLGDHFTVLRGGRNVGEAARGEATRQWMVEKMSGRSFESHARSDNAVGAEPLLEVEELTVATLSQEESATQVRDVMFKLYPGEVLGIYGLLGAGRTELLECIAGLRARTAGSIKLTSSIIEKTGVPTAAKAGIHLVPEDRQCDGLVPEMTIRENMALDFSAGVLLDRKAEAHETERLATELNLVAGNLDLPVTALSGGNQQKVLIARCLMRNPKLLLLDEPTRGVDVRAKAEIYAILRRLAKQGVGVIFTSSEIEETQTLADRVLVLCQGRISAELRGAEITDEALFLAASPKVNAQAGAVLA